MDDVERLLARLASIGGRLRLDAGALKYEGPPGRLTDELRIQIREHKAALLARLRHPVAVLVGQVAAAGFYFRIEDDWPFLEAGDAPDFAAATEAVDELAGREDEVVEFLRKTDDEMTDAELDALGFRRHDGAPILRDPDEPEPRGWTPPPDWQPERGDEEARS